MRPRANREMIIFNLDNKVGNLNINMDIDRMKQVLINILDNAFKFTEPNGCVNLIFDQDDKNVFIKVKDNGCGIPEEELPRVKEKFYKGSNAKSNAGIGLSIADEIVKLHGGECEIESTYLEGTEVTIKLPKIMEEISIWEEK